MLSGQSRRSRGRVLEPKPPPYCAAPEHGGLRKPSQLEEERCRTAILDLSDGNTGRIFRLVETLAVRAIENGTEQIEVGDLDADDLVLPSVSMKALAQRRGRGRAKAAAA